MEDPLNLNLKQMILGHHHHHHQPFFLPTDKSWDPEENLTISWFA